jgi:hypothetical protein
MSEPKKTQATNDAIVDLKRDFMMKDDGPWSSAWKIAAGVGGLGAVLTFALGMGDMKRTSYSYVFAFFCFLTIALGSAFFVIIQRLTSAGWSVTVRRTAEFFTYGLLAMVLMAIPLLLNMHLISPMLAHKGGSAHAALLIGDARADLGPAVPVKASAAIAQAAPTVAADPHAEAAHAVATAAAAAHDPHAMPSAAADPHAMPSAAGLHDAHPTGAEHPAEHTAGASHEGHDPTHIAHEEVLEKKSAWFAPNFFYGRGLGYLVIWALLAVKFFGLSTQQDKSKDPALTLQAQSIAPVATMFFGLSLTFAAFDWVMALEPAWFSTIFGVYTFATSVVSSLAVIILVTMSLRDAGYLKDVVSREHFHDLGKLLFGFNVFWAYIGFSQFMLIWYAALPEETTFYHMRWDDLADPNKMGFWGLVSLAIVFGHFVIPFALLLSRHSKRTHLNRLQLGAVMLLVMHFVEWYWLIMPNLKADFHFAWTDVTCFLAVGGLYFGFVFHRMTKHPLIPVGDPRLQRSIDFQNV